MKKRVLMALVSVLVLTTTASTVTANGGGLVSYWPFDEGSGTTAYDAVNGNHGTINGATYTTDMPAVVGNQSALAFDGTDYVQVPNSPSLEPAEVTAAAWVKSSNPGSYGYILAKGANVCSSASYALYSRGSTGLYFYITPQGASYILSPNGGASAWDGEWHHVAGTYDGSNIRLYVDGAEIDSGTSASVIIRYGLPTTDDFFVGAYRGSCNLYFNGLIDEVGVWDRALSAAEIAALAAGVLEVSIDIKPGSYPNCFNINGHGVIPVAILGSDAFDVTQVNVSTLNFAGLDVRVKGNDKPQCSVEDVSGDFTCPEGAPDGYPDLVCQFMDDATSWDPDDGTAGLTGNLLDGTPIEGSDEICLRPE